MTTSTPEPPTISTFRPGEDVEMFGKEARGVRDRVWKSERGSHPNREWLYFEFLKKKKRTYITDQLGQLQSKPKN